MSSEDELVLFRRAPDRLPRRALQQFARLLVDQVAAGRPFRCLITDDRELRRLNRRFLARDYPTDVLSFPSERPRRFLGELAISVQSATAQAVQYGHSPLEEIEVLMLHGVLHLAGLDHETDRGRMARVEARLRRKLGLPAGLIELERS